MKDVFAVLRQKEFELARLKEEVEALRVVAPLLSDQEEIGDDTRPNSAPLTPVSQLVRVPQAVNASPQPADAGEWVDRAIGWP